MTRVGPPPSPSERPARLQRLARVFQSDHRVARHVRRLRRGAPADEPRAGTEGIGRRRRFDRSRSLGRRRRDRASRRLVRRPRGARALVRRERVSERDETGAGQRGGARRRPRRVSRSTATSRLAQREPSRRHRLARVDGFETRFRADGHETRRTPFQTGACVAVAVVAVAVAVVAVAVAVVPRRRSSAPLVRIPSLLLDVEAEV